MLGFKWGRSEYIISLMVKEEIIIALKQIVGEKDIHLEIPQKDEFGDYSTNIAMVAFEGSGSKSPREYAELIVTQLKAELKLNEIVEKIEVASPGFINFWLKQDVLISNLIEIDRQKENYGKSKLGNTKIIFEFGQPNTHKLPHIGHLFSYVYGNSTSRILEAVGFEIKRANYQGDIGLHVAKCLWAYQKKNPIAPESLEAKVKLLQECYQEGSQAYENDEKAKSEIDTVNRAIYSEDSKISPLWLETRSWSVRYYKEFEARLGIAFDRSYFESEVYKEALEIVKKNSPGVFHKSQGAVIFPGSEYGLHDRVFVNGAGDPTYEAKDLALAKLKMKEYPADKLIVTTASEQNEYFKVLIKALETIDPSFKSRFMHIGFGMVDLKEGKMSSRTGEFIGAIELVNIVVGEIKEILKTRKDVSDEEKEKIAEVVGIGAVKYSFLKNNPLQNMKFDIKESISTEGNSGPYLQYTYARCQSVLAKAGKSKTFKKGTKNMVTDTEELTLLRSLIYFPEVLEKAARDYTPNTICEYLHDLAQKYNAFYNKDKIIASENEEFRLEITKACAQILANGLDLLGIGAPEKM